MNSLPQHDVMSPLVRSVEAASIAVAWTLVGVHIVRLAPSFNWWTVPAALAGMLTADLVSGLVHWGADTWGSESIPVIGRRFLRPFRVHHINPEDFLRRDFVDCNGDVAMFTLPFLLALFVVPSVFGLAFCAVLLNVNQIHQWAHMPQRPAVVAWLQRCGMILDYDQHLLHHEEPHTTHYCITTGWCNRPLEALQFFTTLERVISGATGALPRA